MNSFKKISRNIILFTCLIAALLAAYHMLSQFIFHVGFEYLVTNTAKTLRNLNENPSIFLAGYFIFFILYTSLSLPGALILTIGSGAMFGIYLGVIVASFASTIGALIAFLLARYLFRNYMWKKYRNIIEDFDKKAKGNQEYLLLSLRLMPPVPYFLLNLVFGITTISWWNFYWISQLGMLLGTIFYVNLGTQLSSIETIEQIMSLEIIISFCMVGILPLIGRVIVLKFDKGENSDANSECSSGDNSQAWKT